MELSLPKATLVGILAPLTKVIERRNTIPVLSHVRMTLDGGALEIRATDLAMEVVRSVPVDGDTADGATCLPGRLLLDVVKKMDGDDVRFETTGSNGGYARRVMSGACRFELLGMPAGDYPPLVPADDGRVSSSFTLGAGTLSALLNFVAPSMSKEETRYYLCGVYLHVEDDRLRAVATDGHRLALATTDVPEGAEAMAPVIVPAKAVGALVDVLSGLPFDAPVKVGCTSTWFRTEHGDTTTTTKAIDGLYPPYQKVIPRSNPYRVRVGRKELAEAVDRVATVVESNAASGRAVAFAFAEDGLVLSATTMGGEDADEKVAADVPSELHGHRTGFNPRFVADVLSVMHSEGVVLTFDRDEKPGPIMVLSDDAPEGDADCQVLMPVRV